MNYKNLFNDGWEFAKSSLEVSDSSNLKFEEVDLPHDWLIYDTLNLYEDSIGWYRKKMEYNKKPEQVLLCFDGVYMDSTLYVNGKYTGEWKYGYSSFEHDITDALIDGENEILLKVVFQSPNSRWYSGAGIYRNVYLKKRDKNYILTDGIYVTTEEKEEGYQIEIATDMSIYNDVNLSHTIMYGDRVIVTCSERIAATDEAIIHSRQSLFVEDPDLWSIDDPNLYKLVTNLEVVETNKEGDQTGENIREKVESISQNIGFRKIELSPQEGFKLNGTKMKLNGVCEHHDLGALGAAFNKTALRRRFKILKDMGVNAIRTAHNMPAVELMELGDEMGMLVISEAFDMWERPKNRYDYARFFKEWVFCDVENWVKRDRNHPSLLMWSIGNEIYDTHVGKKGQKLTRMLRDEVLKYDPKENGKITIGSNYMPWKNTQKCADILKIAGYNYAEKYYLKHHQEHPDWVIYGSETSAIVQSRGIYHFPFDESLLADDDEQCSALGNSATSWGASSTEDCIIADRDTPFSLGQFIWTGFDYIGEPTPYHTKNSYFGQIDTATFKKDSYYIYQGEWTDYREKPMVHILPYWDFSQGQMIDVRVCSNAPMIELKLNGKLIGVHNIDHQGGNELVGLWRVPYEEGELKATAYDETGKIIATDVKRSFSDARKIRLNADKDILKANGTDLIFVEITVEDEEGNPVENANNRVDVDVTGAGRLIGLDNGDSTDYDQYKGKSRRLFSGKLMAIIAARLESGDIKIDVSSKALESDSMEFESLPVNKPLEGISANTENQQLPIVIGDREEIPVRKIEINTDSEKLLNQSKDQVDVRAVLYPDNTSYQDVEWSVVNDKGIASNIAKIESYGHEAKVTALGDGEFRVRCSSKNGTEKTKLISEFEFKAVGLGTAYKDPYSFISAGLYDYKKGEVTNGNERGVATSRTGETQLGFHNIDFGPNGSDTITIPIFALSNAEFALQIWEGMPGEEESELLADCIYQKESKWNIYQEETYQLSRKLQGIASICFVLHDKVHIKGFSFKQQNRVYEKNMATNCNNIYGDNFTVTVNSIEGIGNNVSLEFQDMDFGDKGARTLVISGNSPIDNNTIHISFSNGQGESKQIIEFTQSDGYEERVYEIEEITGNQKVTFIFLPGSNFDFEWFQFKQ